MEESRAAGPPTENPAAVGTANGAQRGDIVGTTVANESNRSASPPQRVCESCGQNFTPRAAGKPQKFCSSQCRRGHHDAKPARVKRAQTCKRLENHPQPISNLVRVKPRRNTPEGFDWKEAEEDIVQQNYRRVAVYRNIHGDICIRSERTWDEDNDVFVVVSREHLSRLIQHLEGFL